MSNRGSSSILSAASEEGFALPSVLFLLTILSLLALSILSLNYLRRQAASIEISRLKSDFAAQSAIARSLAADSARASSYRFDDESSASVEISRWGLLELIRSKGQSQRSTSERIALAGLKSPKAFERALVFASHDHQLVFAGDASIEGDIEVGQAGVTTGTMRDYKTPRAIPVKGRVERSGVSVLPRIDYSALEAAIAGYEKLLGPNSSGGSSHLLDLSSIPDTTNLIKLKGPVAVRGAASRRKDPLVIVVDGSVELAAGASLKKLVAIVASGTIILSSGFEADQAVFYSRSAIMISRFVRASAQFIAPVVHLDSAAVLGYPSIVLNYQLSGAPAQRLETVLEAGSSLEGTLVQAIDNQGQANGSGVVLKAGSLVIGAVYSENRLTLDGDVRGTVLTRDLYFYEAPTYYYGWMRRGSIDRVRLPNGFLIPVVFQDAQALDLLDYL